MLIIYFIFGLICGSFVTALVWRLREQELISNSHSKHSKQTLAELSIVKGRSMCPVCHHQLSSVDLLPVFSWLLQQGKCRYCKTHISGEYPLIELFTALAFVCSYIYWPYTTSSAVGIFSLISWLTILVGLIALFVYDLKWFILPNRIIFPLISLAIVRQLVLVLYFQDINLILGSIYGIVVLFGLFYLIFQISGGKWIGGGDVKIGLLIGIIVGGPLMALLVLFIASLSGTIYSLPLITSGRLKKQHTIPFGPFLIFATYIVVLFGAHIINWYKTLLN